LLDVQADEDEKDLNDPEQVTSAVDKSSEVDAKQIGRASLPPSS